MIAYFRNVSMLCCMLCCLFVFFFPEAASPAVAGRLRLLLRRVSPFSEAGAAVNAAHSRFNLCLQFLHLVLMERANMSR